MMNDIKLKTDADWFNANDFRQNENGTMAEIMIQITLAEYRSLIRNDAYQAVRITELRSQLAAAQADNEKLKQQLEIANG